MFVLINKEKSDGWAGNSRKDLSNKSGISYNTLRTWEKKIDKIGRYYEDSVYIYIQVKHVKCKRGNIENLVK